MLVRSRGVVRIVGIWLTLSAVRAVAAHGSPADRIDDFVRAQMQRQHVPGIAIGVVDHGTVVKVQGYGQANLELGVPVGPDTIFQSGSLGKQFTAMAVMLQLEDGKLSLEDPLTKFFPDAPEAWRSITVRHLLTHTSGIPDYVGGALDYRKDYTEDELAHIAFALPLEFPAGARWNYSNTGYVLLGIIVHKVSGSFYGDVLAERVFKPLGMTTTRVISEADVVPNRAAGYRLEDGVVKNQSWVSPTLNTTADGSLYFSVRDLIAWDAAVRARAVLAPASWKEILQPVQLVSGNTFPYGFGWFVDESVGRPVQWHDGGWQGFATQFSRFIGEDLSIIVLTNLAGADTARLVDGIAALQNPNLPVPVPQPVEDLNPEVTASVSRLLDDARAGTLVPSEFAYVRAGFFPRGAGDIAKQLRASGPSQRILLVGRAQQGDDRMFVYEVEFANSSMYCTVAFAPDDRVSVFELHEK